MSNRVEIIAEAAQGYEGDPTLARLLARGAVRAGADSVKFQLVYADELATPHYQHYNLFRSLEMPHDAWRTVAQEIKRGGARLYLDVFGERGLKEAVELQADGVKIHTTDFFNTRLVRSALDIIPRVFISFGGISVQELEAFITLHRISPSQPVCFMYGFQAEPTPVELNNIRRLEALRARFPGYRFGFMDHASGDSDDAMTLSLMALPFGIECIEKHLSLDRTLELEDYGSALSPERFRKFVERIRHLELALGTDDLELTPAEREYRRRAAKVVVAGKGLKRGTALTLDLLSLKRVETPNPSSLYRVEQAVGRALTVDVAPNQQITEEMLS